MTIVVRFQIIMMIQVLNMMMTPCCEDQPSHSEHTWDSDATESRSVGRYFINGCPTEETRA